MAVTNSCILAIAEPASIEALSSLAQALVAFVAAVIVWYEYRIHKDGRRADLALHLVGKFSHGELVPFAVTSLDWGGGNVIVPPSWREIVGDAKPQYLAKIIEDALVVELNEETQKSALGQLYRHAFVSLFNEFEIVAMHVRVDPKLLNELEPIAELAHRICRPLYVQTDRVSRKDRDLYRSALEGWYSKDVLTFVKNLDARFPESGTPAL